MTDEMLVEAMARALVREYTGGLAHGLAWRGWVSMARIALAALPPEMRAVNCHADLVDGCNALLGLFQLLCARDDAPAWLKDAFETSHRVTEARAILSRAQAP